MSSKKNRLTKAEISYCNKLQECLTNPKNEDMSNEIIEPKIKAAFNEFLQALLQNEDDCAEFISQGGITDELELLPLLFNHFKSVKIYEAIKANCEIAFSHKFSVESDELEQMRKDLLLLMQHQLGLST